MCTELARAETFGEDVPKTKVSIRMSDIAVQQGRSHFRIKQTVTKDTDVNGDINKIVLGNITLKHRDCGISIS